MFGNYSSAYILGAGTGGGPGFCGCDCCCGGGALAFFIVFGICALLFVVLGVVGAIGVYKTFEKAGEPGWQGLIPIMNLMTMCRIVGRPENEAFMALIPFYGFFVAYQISVDFARGFGKGPGFAVMMCLPPTIGIAYAILGFGDARFVGRRKRRQRRDDDDYDDEEPDDDDDRPRRNPRRRRDDDEEYE